MFPLLAVAGNIATGKSKLVSFFASQYGFHPIYADKIGHEVLEESDVIENLTKLLGSDILTDDGTINRKIVGQKVFADKGVLEQFNALIHPLLIARALSLIEDQLIKTPVIFEAAILFEAGWNTHFDNIVLTTCEKDEQIKRIIVRDGRTAEQAQQILLRQTEANIIKNRVRWVIDTTKGPDSFYPQLHTISSDLGVMKVEQ
ncbi:dephospho-CoA kinase [bacterium]|nr:dephospho-CoA kinase [bacterium]